MDGNSPLFDIWDRTGELYRETARTSMKYDVSVYDASYIALSMHLRVPLFTADGEILEKLPGKARHVKTFKEQSLRV